MRTRDIVIFFSVVFSLYGIINYYLFLHGMWALEEVPSLHAWYTGVFLFLSLAFIVGRFLERVRITPVSSFLIWIGSFWLAAITYFLLIAFTVDVVRLINWGVPFLPAVLGGAGAKQTLLAGSLLLVGVTVVLGAVNARTPRVKTMRLVIPKNTPRLKSLRVVAASDIHLGTIICKRRLERIVGIINSLDADVVLLPGDVVDEDLGPVINQNLGETLRSIKARYGVFAVTGNHEYIGGVEPACAYLAGHGITMLRDSSAQIADSLYVVGREDVTYNRGRERRRKSLEGLVGHLDRSLPIILMDHQPFRLQEAEEAGIDLQLSGHTHHGQLWPFNYITGRIFEVSWGYKKKGDTHVYVSCGVGSWGPPVRIGNTPEILNFTLVFE